MVPLGSAMSEGHKGAKMTQFAKREVVFRTKAGSKILRKTYSTNLEPQYNETFTSYIERVICENPQCTFSYEEEKNI